MNDIWTRQKGHTTATIYLSDARIPSCHKGAGLRQHDECVEVVVYLRTAIPAHIEPVYQPAQPSPPAYSHLDYCGCGCTYALGKVMRLLFAI